MSVIHHTYSPEKINSFKGILIGKVQKGKSVDYEIRVDGFAVVSRTNDPAHFDDYKKFVIDSTETVNVILYEGQSRNNTNHMFVKGKEAKPQWHPYMDMTPEQVKEEIIAHEKRKWENERLQRELEKERKKNERQEEKSEKQQEYILELENKLRNNEKNWGSIVSYGVEDLLRRGIPLISKIPGAEGLAELLKKEEKANSAIVPRKMETKVPIDSNPSAANENIESQNAANILAKEFSKDKMSAVSSILVSLAKRPEDIEKVQASLDKDSKNGKRKNKLKAFLMKIKDTCQSTIEWVKFKYKLIVFGLKNMKHLKRML